MMMMMMTIIGHAPAIVNRHHHHHKYHCLVAIIGHPGIIANAVKVHFCGDQLDSSR